MIKHSSKQSGSTHVIVIVILVIALLSVLGFVFWKNFIDKKPVVKNDESSKTKDVKSQAKDEYEGWKTYTSSRDGYSIKYPSDWLAVNETSNDGPYIRNFDPSSRPAEDPAHNKNYPKDYINLRVLKTQANDGIFTGSTATEWYAKLGVSTVSNGPVSYAPNSVTDYSLHDMPAKKTKSVFTETDEDIFLVKNGALYNISLYPYGASDNTTVKKMLASFTFLQ
jgi:hypothetical protein